MQDVECVCACANDKETVDHVSWQCSAYTEQRQDLFSRIGRRLQDLPTCLRYAGLVPRTCLLSDDSIKLIQQCLVFVWSTIFASGMTVRTLKLNSNLDCLPLTSKLNTVHENGHVLLPRSKGPGVWCNMSQIYKQSAAR